MDLFTDHTGLVVGINRPNIDTDMIIPKQFLKSIKRTGFGKNLFDELRYKDEGKPGEPCTDRPIVSDFPLNQPRYNGASILLAQENFGCGSSREHAPWALNDFGFRAIIAPSFAEIFYINCLKNGLLPIVLNKKIIDYLFSEVNNKEGYELTINLHKQLVITPSNEILKFKIDGFSKRCLLEGLDEIDLTLKDIDAIKAYEVKHMENSPWIFGAIK
jgi:3-isopropylmalate/(R)-2-methylmalate dehydratase small subunit|tara:strand:- start:821 stop:1468 length:648 start_codon:yes stop_codon:yes gene_type:complete